MKIKTKIQWYSAVWLLTILLLINSAIYILFMKITTDTEIDRLMIQTETIVEALANADRAVYGSQLLRAYIPSNGMIRVINEEKQIVSAVTKDSRLADVPVHFRQNQGHTLHTLEDGERLAIVTFPIIWTDGSVVTLEVTESLAPVQANMHTLSIVLIIASLLVLIPSIFGGRLLSQLILKPISAIVGTMREIQERGTFKKIDIAQTSKDELYTLADTFNRMIERLKRSFDKQQQFVSDASHELKTPLTVIESYASLLKRWGKEKPEVFEEAVAAIATEAERMRMLTEQMLTLAKDEAAGELNLQKVDLVAVCRETTQPFLQMNEREITIHAEDEHIYARADEKKVKQVLYILLDNALKYSDDEVTLRVGYESAHAFVAVADKGIGIPQQDLPHIFDRFYRVDEARTRETGGSGLGLAIARHIIQAQDGDIVATSEARKGSTFHVRLPAFSANSNVLHT